ncbi:MAG TPA: hypothetical protein VGF21_15375 [Thermoleophilaceae bacterium]
MRLVSYRALLPAVLLGLALCLSGCAAEDAARSGTRVVDIDERDFHIEAPRQLAAGAVDLAVENYGPDAHELIVVRANSRRLPVRSDGTTIDEESMEKQEAGALEPGEPGHTRHLEVRLEPGVYELFCNMAGHYSGGMHRRLVVR